MEARVVMLNTGLGETSHCKNASEPPGMISLICLQTKYGTLNREYIRISSPRLYTTISNPKD